MIKRLKINNFRNYSNEDILISENDNSNIIVLFGENGSGKTNILEAISLFSQTKGLRSSKYEEMINKNSNNNFWNISLQTEEAEYLSGYIRGEKSGKRFFKMSDKGVRDLSAFSKDYYVLWMTYETDRLFLQSPSHRRNFIDMFCSVKVKHHMQSVYDYEKLARERLKILKTYFESGMKNDIANWLNIIENKISELGVSIAKTRISIAEELEKFQFHQKSFPEFKNEMTGSLESCIINTEPSNLLDTYKSELFSRRQKDYFSGSTTFGPNRSDWKVFSLKKNIDASLCSAGEQKMLLSGIFLSFVVNMLKTDKRKLILLFDDVIAHLDSSYRHVLFECINNMISLSKEFINIWLSGTSKDLFKEFYGEGLFFEVRNNSIKKDG